MDLAKQHKEYYDTSDEPTIIEFDKIPYITLADMGDPLKEEYRKSINKMYSVAHKVLKDCVMPPIECLWWVDSNEPIEKVDSSKWHWKLLIRMPDFVKSEDIKDDKIVFETIHQGKCVQLMRTGPYNRVKESRQKIESYMKENNLVKNGIYHEIYISDPSITDPSKLKTIVRQPVI